MRNVLASSRQSVLLPALILLLLTIFSILLSILIGTAGFNPPSEFFKTIIFDIRLPRALLSALVGGLLAISGVFMQTLFKNPLAEPYITGVSAGAGLGAVVAISLFTYSFSFTPYILPMSAFIGGILISLSLILIVRDAENVHLRLLLVGIALGTFCASILTFILIRYADRTVRSALFWIFGSVSGAQWIGVYFSVFVLVFGMLFGLLMHRHLDALLLGSDEARSVGVNVTSIQRSLLFFATLLASVAVAFAGIVAFVGLMVPHVCRIFFGAQHFRLLITSLFLGMAFLSFVDILARVIISPSEIPLSVITSLVGSPFLIVILLGIKGESLG